jgi:hypothetical protein
MCLYSGTSTEGGNKGTTYSSFIRRLNLLCSPLNHTVRKEVDFHLCKVRFDDIAVSALHKLNSYDYLKPTFQGRAYCCYNVNLSHARSEVYMAMNNLLPTSSSFTEALVSYHIIIDQREYSCPYVWC